MTGEEQEGSESLNKNLWKAIGEKFALPKDGAAAGASQDSHSASSPATSAGQAARPAGGATPKVHLGAGSSDSLARSKRAWRETAQKLNKEKRENAHSAAPGAANAVSRESPTVVIPGLSANSASRSDAVPHLKPAASSSANTAFNTSATTSKSMSKNTGKSGQNSTGGKKSWAVGLGVLVLLGAAYTGTAYAYSDTVAKGTTVEGIAIGGMSKAEAQAVISKAFASKKLPPLRAKLGTSAENITLDPTSAGLKLDAAKTVDQLVGFSLNPVRLMRQFIGGGEVIPVGEVNSSQLVSALQKIHDEQVAKISLPTVKYVDGKVVSTPSVSVPVLDVPAAKNIIINNWPQTSSGFTVPTAPEKPPISQSELEKTVKDAQAIISGAILVKVDGHDTKLQPAQLAANVTFEPKDGKFTTQVNAPALIGIISGQIPGVLTQPQDARFSFVNNKIMIKPAVTGKTIDVAKFTPELLKTALVPAGGAAGSTTNAGNAGAMRQMTAELQVTQPKTTDDALAAKGVKEVVAEIATPLTRDAGRTRNLIVGAAKVDGTVVEPGAEFSLVAALGDIDTAHGYSESDVIVDGRETKSVGGGLSQMATTTFNLGYLAGMEDIFHKPHSKYFSRYPMGREATLWAPTIDVKWKNNTPYPAVLHTWVAGGKVHGQLWSTKYWDVQVITSDPINKTKSKVVKVPATPDCHSETYQLDGFTVTVRRIVSLHGKQVENKARTWTYKPLDAFICTPVDKMTPEERKAAGVPDPAAAADEGGNSSGGK